MKKLFLYIIIVSITSCKEGGIETNKFLKNKIISSSSVEQELYIKLIDYQKKYPIPEVKDERHLYVYDASFYRRQKDTFLLIVRRSDGILSSKGLLFGVYEDKILMSTVISDSKEFYSKNFIKKIIIDSTSLKSVKPVKGHDYSESFPPIYEYKVIGKKLSLNNIDTVWKKW